MAIASDGALRLTAEARWVGFGAGLVLSTIRVVGYLSRVRGFFGSTQYYPGAAVAPGFIIIFFPRRVVVFHRARRH